MTDSRPKPPKAPPRPPSSSGFDLSEGPVSSRSPDAQLAEVEQALSLLGGRHPEFARIEREKAEAMARRRREIEIAEKRDRKRRVRRASIGVALAALTGVSAWVARERYDAGSRALASSAPYAATFAPLGFSEVVPSPWKSPDKLEVALPSGTCAIALAAAGGKPTTVEVTHDGDTLEAQGSFGFCTCTNETVIIAAKGDDSRGPRSVRLLRTDARELGSVLGFARASVRPNVVDACACREDHLDGWLAGAGKKGLRAPDPKWLEDPRAPARAALANSGVHVVASVAGDVDLFPLALDEGACALVVPSDRDDTLALRVPGGQRPLEAAKGTLAVCSKSARAYGVWHEGKGDVTVLRVRGADVGGRSELGALAQRAGLGAPRTWTEPDDLAWDASLALATAHVAPSEALELLPTTRLPDGLRVLAFSLGAGARVEPDAPGAAFCERMAPATSSYACVDSGPVVWREASGVTGARVGVAHAGLPLWMKALATVPPAESAPAVLSLVRLARALGARRFEPTSLEAVTETASGAVVLGRAGEDAVVAVTVQPTPPYVVTLGERGGWDLSGEPSIVPLAPGRHVALRSDRALSGPIESRRTVVFRRAGEAPAK